jgi:hypothetical protein
VLFNLYLENVVSEWRDSSLLQTNTLAIFLFADDQVFITTSEGSLQKLLHQLPETALTYHLTISRTLQTLIISDVSWAATEVMNYKYLITSVEQLDAHCSTKLDRTQSTKFQQYRLSYMAMKAGDQILK